MESSTNKNYEVQELHEYESTDSFGFRHQKLEDTAKEQPRAQSVWKIPIVIAVVVLMMAMLLMIILQSITIAHLNLLPVVCPEEATAATNTLTGTTDCDTQLLSKVDLLINMSKDIMETENEIVDTSQNILSISDNHYSYSLNNTDWIYQILETTQGSAQKLCEVVQTLSNIKDSNIATEVVVNDILMIVEELLRLQNDSLIYSSHLPISCQDIKDKQPNSPSGYYHINSELVYCEMGELCSTEGGWTRIGYLDMTDSTVDCPSGFKLYESGGVRACGRSSDNAPGCQSIKFPSNGISYSEVCGRVVGYQYASTDAINTGSNSIDSYYVDGVSITQGYPRKHIWTLMAGLQSSSYSLNNCPCSTPPGNNDIEEFIGNDYFCESGNPNGGWSYVFYSDDPLWDGENCFSQEANCCIASGLPWFHKTFDSTTDYLELRVCSNQVNSNEDSPVNLYELYVK